MALEKCITERNFNTCSVRFLFQKIWKLEIIHIIIFLHSKIMVLVSNFLNSGIKNEVVFNLQNKIYNSPPSPMPSPVHRRSLQQNKHFYRFIQRGWVLKCRFLVKTSFTSYRIFPARGSGAINSNLGSWISTANEEKFMQTQWNKVQVISKLYLGLTYTRVDFWFWYKSARHKWLGDALEESISISM